MRQTRSNMRWLQEGLQMETIRRAKQLKQSISQVTPRSVLPQPYRYTSDGRRLWFPNTDIYALAISRSPQLPRPPICLHWHAPQRVLSAASTLIPFHAWSTYTNILFAALISTYREPFRRLSNITLHHPSSVHIARRLICAGIFRIT